MTVDEDHLPWYVLLTFHRPACRQPACSCCTLLSARACCVCLWLVLLHQLVCGSHVLAAGAPATQERGARLLSRKIKSGLFPEFHFSRTWVILRCMGALLRVGVRPCRAAHDRACFRRACLCGNRWEMQCLRPSSNFSSPAARVKRLAREAARQLWTILEGVKSAAARPRNLTVSLYT